MELQVVFTSMYMIYPYFFAFSMAWCLDEDVLILKKLEIFFVGAFMLYNLLVVIVLKTAKNTLFCIFLIFRCVWLEFRVRSASLKFGCFSHDFCNELV